MRNPDKATCSQFTPVSVLRPNDNRSVPVPPGRRHGARMLSSIPSPHVGQDFPAQALHPAWGRLPTHFLLPPLTQHSSPFLPRMLLLSLPKPPTEKKHLFSTFPDHLWMHQSLSPWKNNEFSPVLLKLPTTGR